MSEHEVFWANIAEQIHALESAKTAVAVIEILKPTDPEITSAPGFFAGSGGDLTVWDALNKAGWKRVWFRVTYWWAAQSPDGASHVTYVEGDVYPDLHPRPRGAHD